VLHRTSDRPALGWLTALTLTQLDDNQALLTPLPGRAIGNVARARMDMIANLLGEVLGRKIRATLDESDPVRPAEDAPRPGGDMANGQQGEADPSPATGVGGPSGLDASRAADMAEARSLPLVNQVMRTFPHATVVDARRAGEAAALQGETQARTSDTPPEPDHVNHLPLDIDPPLLDDELYDDED